MSVVTSAVVPWGIFGLDGSAGVPGRTWERRACRVRSVRWVSKPSATMPKTLGKHDAFLGVGSTHGSLTTLSHRGSSEVRAAADTRMAVPTGSKDDDDTDGTGQDTDTTSSSIAEDEKNTNTPVENDGFASLVKFTLPTMAIWMCGPVLSMVDTAVVGTSSLIELAAMTPGAVFVDYPAYLISSSLAVATTTLVAQDRLRKARKRDEGDSQKESIENTEADSEKTIADGMALAFIGGTILSVGLRCIASPTVAAFAGPASAAVVPFALKYATARLW